ncbi:nicotinate (nicotinamide) nucleotide adenylyltransferase [Chlorobium phaeobacteroides]|uniref:Probable nicotinate-nucleotide adenylyltransferase n=1 Tax=Chlorobium phaeobacteroides (strain DSM 266 / SMG 266 / 2430) TaxID=290317 RepID=NADD_CHLPD|nr:nicotinate (nicotinamide) nucleotide adenylyltransferase [Chlorobium phaeobacteroides]A1BJW0.1 RecName: Full=Probable nicotinate-nucleotide adenylyltransferase; AltName: Full=Deamido-NAD(+) diphosphorylase; AltName: Full=Deamido-NAD(+) pyrophosphorylase; AltName: Full=Nicotinate mononucleotide adenylyltransferase; Short=NaMN adenylyltransferase [Chlorobium phaeobacteroides DSM 266]ABL66687.1 nicotinate (nicotinamide) nucleotide adenylyltransferase [Chlorobium phaeobacteroides DSM 266]MBV53199
MHVAVFGGTFDPPHNGHLAMCLLARELLHIDKVILSISNNPFKLLRSDHDDHRKNMVGLLASELKKTELPAEVSGWELQKKTPSYTVELLRFLRTEYPDVQLTLLVGEDSYREFPLWKSYEELVLLCRIAVFRRVPPEQIAHREQRLEMIGNVRFIDFDCPISSTTIRADIASGRPVTAKIPSAINRYIIDHRLYRD